MRKIEIGGCQNYGPFLGPYYSMAPNISGTQEGTIILTTTQIRWSYGCSMAARRQRGLRF